MFESPEAYIQSLVEYFNLEFFGAAWKNESKAFTINDITFIGEVIVNDVVTLFYKVAGETICGTISSYNEGILFGMDYLPE